MNGFSSLFSVSGFGACNIAAGASKVRRGARPKPRRGEALATSDGVI